MSGDDIVSLRAAVEAGTQGVLGPLDHLQCGKVIATLISSRRASQLSQVSRISLYFMATGRIPRLTSHELKLAPVATFF
jgi:hypothetical protein